MSKILVIDIETTGFSSSKNKIVEIAIAELDLKNENIEIVFDELVIDRGLTKEMLINSWIFENSDMTVEMFSDAKPLEDHKSRIQKIINNNPIGATAFNNTFDFRFLEARGFIIPRKLRDPMRISRDICRIPGNKSGYKTPNVEEAYNYFFPSENYIETHRAADDAKHESKIVYKLYKLGVF